MKPAVIIPIVVVCVLLAVCAAQAKPSKADCKAHATSITDLYKELGLSPETTGRALLNSVEAWIESHDAAAIEDLTARIRAATSGVRECEASGFSSRVQAVKTLSLKFESAILPWLQSTSAIDPCHSLINQAARKRAEDLDGAIEDLERSVRECTDDVWLPEARLNLAALYYERGDLDRQDYEKGREQTRLAMECSRNQGEEDRKTLQAILAKPTIEAGQALMERKAHAEARLHWEAYVEIFGSPSFDVLFGVERVAQGAWRLRELIDARFQICLTCMRVADLDCVRSVMLPVVTDYSDDPKPVSELTEKAFERAAQCTGAEREESIVLAFDLLTAWHDLQPDAYQIKAMLQEQVQSRPREERLALLRMTDKCWIPMHIVEALKQEGVDYIDEVEVAAACGESSHEARQMLNEFYLEAANDKLDRLYLARSMQEKRTMMRQIEEQLLPRIDDPTAVADIRSRMAQVRSGMQKQLASAEQEKVEMYSGCVDLLATIQWNRARENEYEREEADFRRGCCGFLMSNASGWERWMRSRPEEERLQDKEIDKKVKLMKRYCQPGK